MLQESIPEEHHIALFADEVSNETLVSVLTNCERKKLSHKERLTMHGKRLTNMILKEDRLGDFIRLWRQYF